MNAAGAVGNLVFLPGLAGVAGDADGAGIVIADPFLARAGRGSRKSAAPSRRCPARRADGGRTRRSVPARSKRISIGPQLRPLSVEIRRRTIAVSWLPETCAVHSSQSRPSGAGNRIGFCSDRVGIVREADRLRPAIRPGCRGGRNRRRCRECLPACRRTTRRPGRRLAAA